jgi:hypothetical protein
MKVFLLKPKFNYVKIMLIFYENEVHAIFHNIIESIILGYLEHHFWLHSYHLIVLYRLVKNIISREPKIILYIIMLLKSF